MNKEQLIELLRQDAEWWALPVGSVPYVEEIAPLREIRNEWGWDYIDNDYETECWFNLFIAEAIEKEIL